MNIERGKYWDEACNPIVTDRFNCTFCGHGHDLPKFDCPVCGRPGELDVYDERGHNL